MPSVGHRSTEQTDDDTRTISVSRDPAAPSTRPCDALRSAGIQAGVPAAEVGGAAVSGGTVATGSVGNAVIGGVVGPVVESTGVVGVGDPQAATNAATM